MSKSQTKIQKVGREVVRVSIGNTSVQLWGPIIGSTPNNSNSSGRVQSGYSCPKTTLKTMPPNKVGK